MFLTNYGEGIVLNTLRGIAAGAPSQMYVGLLLVNPTDAGTGTEVSYIGYQRQAIDFSAPADEGSGIEMVNETDIAFPKPTSNVGTATYIGIYDSLTSGNMYAYGELTTPQTIEADDSPVLRQGKIKFSLTGNMGDYFKSKVLNLFRGISCDGMTPYLALYDGDPQGDGIEFSDNGYVRMPITFSEPADSDNNRKIIQNSSKIEFPIATADWGSLAYIALLADNVDSNVLFFKEKTPAKNIKKDYQISIDTGNYKIAVN